MKTAVRLTNPGVMLLRPVLQMLHAVLLKLLMPENGGGGTTPHLNAAHLTCHTLLTEYAAVEMTAVPQELNGTQKLRPARPAIALNAATSLAVMN